MPRTLKARLAVMMFLEYMVPGATTPILSHYLKNYLHFPPYQVGYILSVLAVAAFVAPFVASHIADRWIRSERFLALCHLASATAMVALVHQDTFWPFLAIYFLYGLAFTPTFGLTNAIALHHVRDARRDFGGIRMWGTAGWVAVAWIFSFLWLGTGGSSTHRLPHALYASALCSLFLAAYSLTLPRSAAAPAAHPTSLMYWKSLKMLARPGLAILCVLTFAASMTHQIYYYGMSPYLSQAGFPNQYIMPAMSIGQVSEVALLGMLGLCLTRITIKQALIIGLAAQALRYILFAYGGNSMPLILTGIALHGICYAFYFTCAYIYIDTHSTIDTRAGLQQLFTIMIAGFGTFAAYVAGGYLGQYFTRPATAAIDFRMFWLAPAILSLAVAAILAACFHEEPKASR